MVPPTDYRHSELVCLWFPGLVAWLPLFLWNAVIFSIWAAFYYLKAHQPSCLLHINRGAANSCPTSNLTRSTHFITGISSHGFPLHCAVSWIFSLQRIIDHRSLQQVWYGLSCLTPSFLPLSAFSIIPVRIPDSSPTWLMSWLETASCIPPLPTLLSLLAGQISRTTTELLRFGVIWNQAQKDSY